MRMLESSRPELRILAIPILRCRGSNPSSPRVAEFEPNADNPRDQRRDVVQLLTRLHLGADGTASADPHGKLDVFRERRGHLARGGRAHPLQVLGRGIGVNRRASQTMDRG
jgi:hypothetical protein